MENTQGRSRISGRLVIGGIIAVISIIGYFANSSLNPVTGRKQHIALTQDQEVALGLQSAPEMIQQFGGLSRDDRAMRLVETVGQKIVASLPPEAPQYPFKYHLLADSRTVNAFALPGGQIFITEALLSRLQTEGQLAGVLGHETGHVLGRHSAQQIAKSELTQGLVGAATVAGGSDGRSNTGALAQMVGQYVLLKYGRDDELESDRLGVDLMIRAGYDPKAMIGVMKVLEQASGGGHGPDFASTHPSPADRTEQINALLAKKYPAGVPTGLKP